MPGWMKHKLESWLPGEISIISEKQWHHPYGRKWRRTKEPLNENERGDWKVGLKLNIQKTKIMASGPIPSWQIDGETVEIVTGLFLGGSIIIAEGDCSHEIKRHSLERKFWRFIFNISSSNEHSGLISFRMDWLDLLQSKGLSRVFSNTTVQKHQFFSTQLSLQSNSHIHTWSLEKP